jgi:GntR family transcriptional regulator
METADRIVRDVERLTSFTEDIRASGRVAGSRTLRCRLASGIEACERLGEPEVVELVRLRTASGRPVCIEHTCLPRRAWALVEHAELDSASLYALLEDHGERIVRSEDLLIARLASEEELQWLGRTAPLSVAAISRLCFDDHDRAIEITENVLVGDAYVFRFALKRRQGAERRSTGTGARG